MVDSDLAVLYGVTTKRLNEQVKRNISRFPDDFMFRLNAEESQYITSMRSQFATASKRNARFLPRVFSEHGALMLASVLDSQTAIEMSIVIIRAFVSLRLLANQHKDIAKKFEELDRKYSKHDEDLNFVFKTLRQLMTPPVFPKKRRIGF